MGILRIVVGVAIAFACLYFLMTRNTHAPTKPGGATTAPGQTAETVKKKFETAAENAEDHGDEVQKKLDDAVQGK